MELHNSTHDCAANTVQIDRIKANDMKYIKKKWKISQRKKSIKETNYANIDNSQRSAYTHPMCMRIQVNMCVSVCEHYLCTCSSE